MNVHEAFALATQRHAWVLDAWERNAKAAITKLAEFHRRSLAQHARTIRVQLMAQWEPTMSDPDYVRVLQLRRQRQRELMLDATDTLLAYEERIRLVIDQPFFTLSPKGQV